ncbi:unnamed protein product [Rhizophagus irregularis]|nr:unnamed protein product [Rhizophagus irregularis]
MKTQRFIRSDELPKNKNPKICKSSGLLKNENPKIRLGRLLKNENPKIKIRLSGVGFQPSGKEKPRFTSDWLPTFRKVESRFVNTNLDFGYLRFGWIAKEQSKICIYKYMDHVIVELYLN